MRDIEEKRGKVLNAYSGESWKKKVNAMNDNQILAVYKRFTRCGRILERTR